MRSSTFKFVKFFTAGTVFGGFGSTGFGTTGQSTGFGSTSAASSTAPAFGGFGSGFGTSTTSTGIVFNCVYGQVLKVKNFGVRFNRCN